MPVKEAAVPSDGVLFKAVASEDEVMPEVREAISFEAVAYEVDVMLELVSELGDVVPEAVLEQITGLGGDVGDVGGGDFHAHVPEAVPTPSCVEHSTSIGPSVLVDNHPTESEAVVDQPDADRAEAFVHEEDVYQPVIDGGCEPQSDIRVDDEFFPILEDITDELFMSEVDTHVQGSAPTEAAPETVVGEVPQQFFQDDLYRPSFEYAPDGCHLHN